MRNPHIFAKLTACSRKQQLLGAAVALALIGGVYGLQPSAEQAFIAQTEAELPAKDLPRLAVLQTQAEAWRKQEYLKLTKVLQIQPATFPQAFRASLPQLSQLDKVLADINIARQVHLQYDRRSAI